MSDDEFFDADSGEEDQARATSLSVASRDSPKSKAPTDNAKEFFLQSSLEDFHEALVFVLDHVLPKITAFSSNSSGSFEISFASKLSCNFKDIPSTGITALNLGSVQIENKLSGKFTAGDQTTVQMQLGDNQVMGTIRIGYGWASAPVTGNLTHIVLKKETEDLTLTMSTPSITLGTYTLNQLKDTFSEPSWNEAP